MTQNIEFKWFMNHQGQIKGPMSTESLQSVIDGMETKALEQTLIWKRGLPEWVKATQWQVTDYTKSVYIPTAEPVENTSTETQQPMSGAQQALTKAKPAATPVQRPALQETFYKVQVNFVDQPLMSKNELLNLIAKHEDISTIAIQDPKTQDWKEVYAFPDIIEKLGLSRRKHPRVPILAQFQGTTNRHDEFFARVITISEGGVGLTDVFDLKIGDEAEGQITSPHFFQPIHVQADVVYSGLDGYIGLKFNQINDESQAAIIDYIKKFGKGTP